MINTEGLNLPLIPMPKELANLPPLPKAQEEAMRILARHAIEIMLERHRKGILKIPKNGSNVEVDQ